jgi:hypothetical protein
MPYVRTFPGKPESPTQQKAVVSAVKQMAEQGLYHNDLHWRHVGLLSPIKGKSKVVLYDLAQVTETESSTALSDMLKKLELDDSDIDE